MDEVDHRDVIDVRDRMDRAGKPAGCVNVGRIVRAAHHCGVRRHARRVFRRQRVPYARTVVGARQALESKVTNTSIRIDSPARGAAASKAVQICYLCGSTLRDRDELNVDHVIPKAVLGPSPGDNAWRVTLKVHESCHDSKRADQDLATWHRMNTRPSSEWNSGNVRGLPLRPAGRELHESGRVLPRVTNVQGLLDGVWTWVRGCHALLYGTYLPHGMQNVVLPPNPGYMTHELSPWTGKKLPGATLEQIETEKATYCHLLDAAIEADTFDGIRAWGGTFLYVCTWSAAHKKNKPQKCFWGMAFRALDQYSRDLPWGTDSWCGEYVAVRAPVNRTSLRESAIDKYVELKGIPTGMDESGIPKS